MTYIQKKYSILDISYLVFFVLLAGILCFAFPANAGAEYIESFRADIDVKKDSSFAVTETISYVFTEERHGMYRCIPLLHSEQPQSPLRERYIDIELKSIVMDGGSVPYTITDGTEWCAKIGDPDSTISGAHTYEIAYVVSGAITYEKNGGADLYWNVTGNKWEVPIQSIEARVISADSILLRERSCYRGFEGDPASCESKAGEDGVVLFSGRNFDIGEGMTIAQALNRNIISIDVRERYKLGVILLLVLPVLLAWIAYTIYQYKTAYKTGNTIIPQYEPYEGVKPMYAGYLFDKRLDPRDITAGIVYLAEQGYIRIKKIDRKVLFFFEVDDYEIELLKSTDDLEGTFEKEVLSLVFYNFSDVGSKITLSDLKSNYAQSRENYKKIQALKESLEKDLQKNGFYTYRFNIFGTFDYEFDLFKGKGDHRLILQMVMVSIVVAFWACIYFFPGVTFSLIMIPFVLAVLVSLISRRRTRKGYEALDHLKGFKDFLRVTESQRYIFHNAPERNAEHFMEFLPYAIAFGVEKEWAKTFEGITIPNPDWYDGGGSVSTFNTVSLTQSLGAFSTAFASSGASGGGSASGGGGFSGGGSGGGGGGSW